MIPGRHIPVDSDIKLAAKLKDDFDDSCSMVSSMAPSVASVSTAYTKWNNDNRSTISGISGRTVKQDPDDFPPVGGSRNRNKHRGDASSDGSASPKHVKHEFKRETDDDSENPWMSRNQSTVREPLDTSLTFPTEGKFRYSYHQTIF